jgi:phenylalanine-4-hydroxylase
MYLLLQLQELSAVLQKETGWTIRPVVGEVGMLSSWPLLLSLSSFSTAE